MEYSVDRDGDIVAIGSDFNDEDCYGKWISNRYNTEMTVKCKVYVNYDSRFKATLLDILLGVE